MSLPAFQQHAYQPGDSPAAHGEPPGAQSADTQKRRADDQRRLRRVKDSREQLKSRTRARAASNGTIETTSSSTAGRSYTVANVHHGVIYLRYVGCVLSWMQRALLAETTKERIARTPPPSVPSRPPGQQPHCAPRLY
jgi:hypothetical protein